MRMSSEVRSNINLAARDAVAAIAKFSIPQSGDVFQYDDDAMEKHNMLFGSVQYSWKWIEPYVSQKTKDAYSNLMKALHCDYEGTKMIAMTFFTQIAQEPNKH